MYDSHVFLFHNDSPSRPDCISPSASSYLAQIITHDPKKYNIYNSRKRAYFLYDKKIPTAGKLPPVGISKRGG